MSHDKKDQYPYTGHWFFVPFNPTAQITQALILGMMENQNHFLENQISITVQGFSDIELMVEDPDTPPADENDTSME
eukprot:5483335-Ditylum_brightwellii.AAC.1